MRPLSAFWLFATLLSVQAGAVENPVTVTNHTSKAVQTAIDAAAAPGGGVAYLPPGRYVSGPLWLKDNVELRLDAGATLVMSHDKKDWPGNEPALINARGAKRIAITGRGTFDGDARWEFKPVFREDPEIRWEEENAQRAGFWQLLRAARWGDCPLSSVGRFLT